MKPHERLSRGYKTGRKRTPMAFCETNPMKGRERTYGILKINPMEGPKHNPMKGTSHSHIADRITPGKISLSTPFFLLRLALG